MLTHIEQNEGDGVDLPYGDKVSDNDWHWRAENEPKRVVLVLSNNGLSIEEGTTWGSTYGPPRLC